MSDAGDRLQALASEHEAEIGYLCRRDEETIGAVIRVFKDKPGFVRIDALTQSGESVQLVLAQEGLQRRADEPQSHPEDLPHDQQRPRWLPPEPG